MKPRTSSNNIAAGLITAKYEDGVLKPLETVTINEGTMVEVHVPSHADRLRAKSRSVRDFAFYGMWKNRTDLRRDIRG